MKLSTLLKMDLFAGVRVLAGAEAVDNQVSWINMMEILNAFDRLQPGELLISTGFGLEDDPESAEGVISKLAERRIAGLAFQVGCYIDRIPPAFLRSADLHRLPLIELPAALTFGRITKALFELIRHVSEAPTGERTLLRLDESILDNEPAMTRFLDDLLEKKDEAGSKNLAARADLLGFDLSLPYRVGILRLIPPPPAGLTAEDLRETPFDRIRSRPFRFDALHWRTGRAQCIALFSSRRDDGTEQFREALSEPSVLPEGIRCEMGLGGIAATCDEIPRSLWEAQAALTLGKCLSRPEAVTAYKSVMTLDFLHSTKREGELERFYRDSIAPLREHDRANWTQYAPTLKVYLSVLHKAEAAQALFIHRQTLAYRLDRIRELIGRDPENPDDRLTLQLGFAVEALFSACSPHRRL